MYENYDVIIVGTGAAGLFSALMFDEKYKILVITKDSPELSDSFLAQGGISTLLNKEDYESYYEDTMKAGHYKNNPEAVSIMINSSPEIIDDLVHFGVKFAHDENGVTYTREGGHSKFRIMYHDDITGNEITGKLLKQASILDHITIKMSTTMIDIIEEDNTVKGVIVDHKGKRQAIYSKAVILATGGIGGLFTSSTNFPHLTGDSLAISLNHNIELADINYIQIHPTTLYSKKKGRRFLISESVRGEGAILLNPNKERFVDELLPRDIVAEAIRKEEEKFNTDHVYLSLTHMDKDEIIKRFPNIYKKCEEEGYKMEKDLVPITPAQHYFMGGIKVDMNSQTNKNCLYAIGETSCNGVHGANRLASNSLLESLVFAKRAAQHIQTYIDDIDLSYVDVEINNDDYDTIENNYAKIVLNEIKRKDKDFYDKWCKHED
jgi:L-aspartate oxidase